MSCIDTETVADLAMAKSLGETLDPRVATHLDSCPACRETFDTATKTARDLARLARNPAPASGSPCLSANDLSEYLDGAARESDTGRIEAHLAACQVCVAALAELDAVLRAADTAQSPVHYAIRLLKTGVQFLTRPELGFRFSRTELVPTLAENGGEALSVWTQRIDGQPIHFKLQQGKSGGVHLTIALDPGTFDPQQATLTLRKNGDLIQSGPLEEEGRFRLPELQRGLYAFELQTTRDTSIRIEMDLR